MIRHIIRRLLVWAFPELERMKSELTLITTINANQAECVGRLTQVVMANRDAIALWATSPTDKALNARVAKLELMLMAPVSDEWRESAYEAARIAAICGGGEGEVKS